MLLQDQCRIIVQKPPPSGISSFFHKEKKVVDYYLNGIGACTSMWKSGAKSCKLVKREQLKRPKLLGKKNVKWRSNRTESFYTESHHLLMKVCCLLCQFHHHSLIEELIYAHILTHSLRDLLPEQRLLNDFCISQLFHKRLKDKASRRLQRLQNIEFYRQKTSEEKL